MIAKVDIQKVLDEMAFVKSDPNNMVTQHIWEDFTSDGKHKIRVKLEEELADKFGTVYIID